MSSDSGATRPAVVLDTNVIVSGLGSPNRIVARARNAGIKVMSLGSSSRHAKKVAEASVDVGIASGSDVVATG